MQSRRWIKTMGAVLLTFIIITVLAGIAGAAKYKAIYKFKVQNDGRTPMASMVFDTAGNLYGTTANGGPNRTGNVFELSPNPDGTWTEKVIYNFLGSKYGGHPSGGLVLDAAGNLYGTTLDGGKYKRGTVFQLVPSPDDTWTESVLHSFKGNDKDGGDPASRMLWGVDGSLYGTTPSGGAYSGGTVFQLTPDPDGSWSESVILDFDCAEGCSPRAGLTADATGNLYGTAFEGSPDNAGIVFELSQDPGGTWTENLVYRFTGRADGGYPVSGVTFGPDGNLYGATTGGGNLSQCRAGCGVVFRLKATDAGWEERAVHAFGGHPATLISGDLAFDPSGNLYGVTIYSILHGGQCCGLVYKLAPQGDGTWKIDQAHFFHGPDGAFPHVGLVVDSAGRLYGTTPYGGHGYGTHNRFRSGAGVVFEITPK